MIQITSHSEGCILPVRAQPGARKNGVIGEHAGALKVAVTAPPEKGRANAAIIELLQELLSIKRSQIALLSGETSRDKRFLIRSSSPADLQTLLQRLLS